MKSRGKKWMMAGLMVCIALPIAIGTIGVVGCSDDDDTNVAPIGQEKTYTLAPLAGSGVSGTITFEKVSKTSTLATIQLTGTETGSIHPAHVHDGNAAAGGAIAVDFTNVDGTTGRSETTIMELNDGTPVTYEQLIRFNGYVNIHLSALELGVIIAQGNIGSNVGDPTDPYD